MKYGPVACRCSVQLNNSMDGIVFAHSVCEGHSEFKDSMAELWEAIKLEGQLNNTIWRLVAEREDLKHFAINSSIVTDKGELLSSDGLNFRFTGSGKDRYMEVIGSETTEDQRQEIISIIKNVFGEQVAGRVTVL